MRDDDRTVEDGFGNCWRKCLKPNCDLQVVRPGKVQCNGDYDDSCDWGDE